jgi:flagellar biosynthesis protein FlhF
MLMNSRRTDAELKHLGGYEVVFGVAQDTPPKPPEPKNSPEPSETLARELADLRKQIDSVKRSVSRQIFQPSAPRSYPELASVQEQLLAADFSEGTTHEIIQSLEKHIANHRQDSIRIARDSFKTSNEQLLRSALEYEMDARLTVAPGLLNSPNDRRTVVFIGPPGAGKTTTVAKLAMRYGLANRIPMQIISTDTLRVGGSEQLGAYARILGIGFQAVHSAAGLGQAIEEHRAKQLILVDTPGYGPANLQDARDFAGFLSRERRIDVQLVMPAVLRPSSAWRIYERYTIFKPSKLLFTHVDDSPTPGGVLELAFRTCLPISYLASGQDIPEDIEEASKERLIENFFSSFQTVVQAAA